MAPQPSSIKQGVTTKLFKAAQSAGFEMARVIFHPDGRIEVSASFADPAKNPNAENEWDDVLR